MSAKVLDTEAVRAVGDVVVQVRDAAAILGLSKPTLYRLMATGVLPYVQLTIGRRAMLASDMRAFLEARRVPADSEGDACQRRGGRAA